MMARFTIPRDIYHGKGSLENLKTLQGKKTGRRLPIDAAKAIANRALRRKTSFWNVSTTSP